MSGHSTPQGRTWLVCAGTRDREYITTLLGREHPGDAIRVIEQGIAMREIARDNPQYYCAVGEGVDDVAPVNLAVALKGDNKGRVVLLVGEDGSILAHAASMGVVTRVTRLLKSNERPHFDVIPGSKGASRPVSPRSQSHMGRKATVISVLSPSGGAGVTTAAIMLACWAAGHAKKCALIDFDLQFGCVLRSFGLHEGVHAEKFFELLDGGMNHEELCMHGFSRPAHGLALLGCCELPEHAEQYEQRASDVLDASSPYFDVIVADLPKRFSETSAQVLERSDRAIIVADFSDSRRGHVGSLVGLMRRLGFERTRAKALLNRAPMTHQSEQELSIFGSSVGISEVSLMPDGGQRVAEHLASGRAIELAVSSNPYALRMASFAHSLISELGLHTPSDFVSQKEPTSLRMVGAGRPFERVLTLIKGAEALLKKGA